MINLSFQIRISKKDFETEVGKKYGGQDMWHHVTCFAKLRSELGYFESADKLPGFKSLSKADQKDAAAQIPYVLNAWNLKVVCYYNLFFRAIKQEDVPDLKKVKTEDEADGGSVDENKMKEQNQIMFKYRDQLKRNLTKSQLTDLLIYNNQQVPVGEERVS